MQRLILPKQKYSQHVSYIFLFTAYLILLTFLNNEASATMVRPIGLNEMQKQAHVIYHVRCIDNRIDHDSKTKLIATWTTFEIIESIKDKGKNTAKINSLYTIKQIGGTLPSGIKYQVPEVPKFITGEEYIIFLPKKSKLGFSSPVALSYGQFSVFTTATGKKVTNNRDFKDLLKQIPDNKLTAKAMSLKHSNKTLLDPKERSHMDILDFKDLLRKLVSNKAGRP